MADEKNSTEPKDPLVERIYDRVDDALDRMDAKLEGETDEEAREWNGARREPDTGGGAEEPNSPGADGDGKSADAGPGEGEGAEKSEGGEADGGEAGDAGGGYTPSSGGASYAGDIAMMRAEVDYTSKTVIPHFEMLIAQATNVGNGPKTLQALNAGLEGARSALGAAQDAISKVQATSEPVQAAYDDSGGEAAKSKTYFHGD